MSPNVLFLRMLVEQRLTAAAEEIFGLFERTIAEYEEELCRTKEENQRQRQILDSVLNPRVLMHKTDVQEPPVVVEEVSPEQREWNPIVDQEEPEPELPHIKEEQEELWTSQEVNITKFPSTPVPVKSEDDDDELKETLSEEKKVDFEESEPSSSFHPYTYGQNEDCEETEDSDEDLTLNRTETDGDDGGGSEPDIILVHIGSEKGRTIDSQSLLEEHMDTHTAQKLDGSSEYEATCSQTKDAMLETDSPSDMMMNTDWTVSGVGCEKKLFHCSMCSKTFCSKSYLKIHMKAHTGVSYGFDCSVCGKRLTSNSILTTHMRLHTGERPFICSKCGKRFIQKKSMERHMRLHTGERPYCCSECGKRFTQRTSLKNHMRLHTGERPFSCVVCQKRFRRKHHLTIHMKIHTRE